jgi:transcriptional regulator GlxA family with amidase domain
MGRKMKRIAFVASDSSSISGITGGLEVFEIANFLRRIQSPGKPKQFECSVVSIEKGSFPISPGLVCEFSKGLSTEEQYDAIILIGFTYKDISQLITKIESSRKAVSWIQNQYSAGALIGASCSATLLLAETGLLDGKSATTSWWLNSFFKNRYPKIKLEIGELLVENNRLICSGAVTSYLNLVLCIIENFTDKALALSCSKMMLIDINKNSQAPYVMQQKLLDLSDDMVTRAQHWIYANFQNKIDFQILSSHLAVSYRTFIRRFKSATGETPSKYLQKIRIEASKDLLETTNLSLETILESVGYSDTSSFSILFKRLTHLTPKEYRVRFSMDQTKQMK